MATAWAGSTVPVGLPPWTRTAAVGDYGGATDKRACLSEGTTPYAYSVYRELQAQRGSGFSQKKDGTTLVHCEHIAIGRALGALCFRYPEKYRASALPSGSDERLPYWVKILGVPSSPTDERWQVRQRCAAQFQSAVGPTIQNITDALTLLLGSVLVAVDTQIGTSLSVPPPATYWPVFNPGVASYSLGGGAWFSERCHLFVRVVQSPNMSTVDFLQLMNVQMFQLLDRILPAWATFAWGTSNGFTVDVSQLDFDGV